MIKRKKTRYRNGEIIDVEEYHAGKYGAPGVSRAKKRKLTKEQIQEVNARNKAKRCRQRLLEYFSEGDIFATWTYKKENRPSCINEALKDFQKAIRYVRREYKKRGCELYWIRNIEQGTKGAWHIHIVINQIGDTAGILEKAWEKGGMWFSEIKKSKFCDEDMTALASYMTKDENTKEKKKNGELAKPRLKTANYNISRNMPLPEPKIDKIYRWKAEPKPQKGYYIARIYEGINPATRFKYRQYTMIRYKLE